MFAILAGILAVQAMTLPVNAQTENKEVPVRWENFISQGSAFVEDTYMPRIRSSVMYSGYIRLEDENGKAGVYGETLAIRKSDIVGLELYLDQYTGGSYGTYTYWHSEEQNTSKNIKSYTVSVPKGYYYRLHGYHYVEDGSDFENGETLTQGLKIPQY